MKKIFLFILPLMAINVYANNAPTEDDLKVLTQRLSRIKDFISRNVDRDFSKSLPPESSDEQIADFAQGVLAQTKKTALMEILPLADILNDYDQPWAAALLRDIGNAFEKPVEEIPGILANLVGDLMKNAGEETTFMDDRAVPSADVSSFRKDQHNYAGEETTFMDDRTVPSADVSSFRKDQHNSKTFLDLPYDVRAKALSKIIDTISFARENLEKHIAEGFGSKLPNPVSEEIANNFNRKNTEDFIKSSVIDKLPLVGRIIGENLANEINLFENSSLENWPVHLEKIEKYLINKRGLYNDQANVNVNPTGMI